MGSPARILYCHCAYAQVVPKDVKEQVLLELTASDRAFDMVPDLCELSAKADPTLAELCSGRADDEPLQIVACFPRAVKWLFSAAGVPLPEHGVEILNMRTESAESVVAAVLGHPEAAEVEAP